MFSVSGEFEKNNGRNDCKGFCPVSLSEMDGQPDFVLITGDAYVDHPSFAHAIISRVLQHNGYSVGIIAQPNWKDCSDFGRFGKPRLAFLVSPGNIDSMVNNYTVAKKKRNTDVYSPGGQAGRRPDRALIVYCSKIRELYGRQVPIIIGGLEAGLRRFAHYDYWSDRVRRSVLIDSQADILCYGMGERTIKELADKLSQGMNVKEIKDVPGTCYIERKEEIQPNLPSFDDVKNDKLKYATMCAILHGYKRVNGDKLVQEYNNGEFVVQNPPQPALTQEEMDTVYSLPYMRTYHPSYEEQGGVPAINEVKFSIISSRGCFGGCNFCAIHFHQGKGISSRSHKSILKEAKIISELPDFKGYIHDVGGPTANFRHSPCKNHSVCNKNCLCPSPCKNLYVSHKDYLELLRAIRKIPGVKKVFVRSGLRYDYIMADTKSVFLKELCEHHVSGQLKIAPEHISPKVLKAMGKPEKEVYEKFSEKFYEINRKLGKKQFLVPYLMSSHPGSTIMDAIYLAEFLRDNNMTPEQVQDFYPTPGTVSTCSYYTGIDITTFEPIYVARSYEEKAMQRALLQYKNPKNYDLVYKALRLAGREDLIGYSKKCLIKPKGVNNYGKNIRWKGNKQKNKGGTKRRGKNS